MTQHDLDLVRKQVADEVIAALAGPGAVLRADQQSAVAALCRPAARVLVVQATGWGKSAVYWAATAIRRREGAGPTLVVSPLLSLMRDQVAAAAKAGLRAATLNSANVDDWSSIEESLLADRVDVLLVSPERLANPTFGRRILDTLTGRLGLLVIDEAHSVSDWGHDFRPDYRRLTRILTQLDPDTPVLACTATANARVTDDLADQLGASTTVLRGPLARASLQLAVTRQMSTLHRYAWVVDNLARLSGSGIVYTLTVADAERLSAVLADAYGPGHVACYTSKLEPAERERVEDGLRANTVKAVVATSALGMGFDKPDLGFVVHVGAPPTPVAYYQQVGRAGRGVDHAVVVLLPSASDEAVWDYFATATVPDPAHIDRILAALGGSQLAGSGTPASVPAIEAASGVRRGKVELALKQLAVDDVVERVEGGWRVTGAPWEYDKQQYDTVVAQRRAEAELMRAYIGGAGCLMQLLQTSLDDPHASECGRCSVCTGELPTGLTSDATAESLRAVTRRLRGTDTFVEPRKMWPGGAWGSRSRIDPGQLATSGRAIAFADDPGWQDLVGETFASDRPARPELVEAAVAVLTRWKRAWDARPGIVASLSAAGYPLLTRSLAQELATVGRMDVIHLDVTGQPPVSATGGGEASWWRDHLSGAGQIAHLRGGGGGGEAGPAGAGADSERGVLLVVDASASLWPVTVAAAQLRDAGAAFVLPLLIHRRP